MSGYPYPPDEFDTELDDSHALGIHHAPRSTWSKVWPFFLVIVVCAALAAALVTWFASQGQPRAGATTPPAATATTPTGSDQPTDDPPTDEPTDEATDEPTDDPTTDEPTDEPTTDEPTTAELNRATAIRVLNATRTRGLAASRVAMLNEAGWTSVVGDNFPADSTPPATSSVWYRSVDLEDEAKQIAEDLGLTSVTLVEGLRGEVSVILVG